MHRSPRQFFLSERESMSDHISRSMSRNTACLNLGTKYMLYEECECRDGWHGKSCSIPDCLYYSYRRHSMTTAEKREIYLRKKTARRIIYAVLFNHEFDMLEALLNEHFDLVDVFIILESSYTAFGTRKPLRLLPRLHRGYLRKFHSKLMYLYCDHFPTGGRKKGWKADSYYRSLLGKKGLTNIHNLKDDDLFIVMDIDEIPSYDSLVFLKYYNRYPEPFGVRLRYSVFGYFWKNNQYTQVTIGCTIGMLKTVYSNDSNAIRDIEHGLNAALLFQT
ncbi:Beta-1,4-mannosyl-glycoprotein 4-beta-N-acetylglucosaminyltransferase [Exaiptasia diaphana]|nr:Beta-1,4-mannosyl-glycoprotein 4-beta-N-acetylglucosaminyltransferase [Exaiptasia diaphana]